MYTDVNKQRASTPSGPVLTQRLGIELQGRVRAVILLAGSVRANSLRKATDRFVMDLPIDAQKTVLDCWHDQLDDLAFELKLDQLPARVMIDRSSSAPRASEKTGPTQILIEQDPLAFRGTGGLVSDVAKEYGDDEYLIVAHAAQLLLTPLPRLVEAMAKQQADISLLCDADSRPHGVTLIRCGALRDVPSVGFVDLNEQALPAISENHTVKVCRSPQRASMAIRTRQNYLDAVRKYHQRHHPRQRFAESMPHEDWDVTFGIIEPGAEVDPSAVVHDSVVLAGGRVQAGAVLVRSVVGPRGRVAKGESAVECIATAHTDETRNQNLSWL